ncbi:MAG: hypothetical protein J6C55_01540 [Oscillospiraceae bacterium]|nr:hypothetical protein [Oscillospiraceae bacterium]
MIFKTKYFDLEISFYFLVIIALILSTDKTYINIYFFISILIHELGHLLTILYYKIKISKISLKIYGISIEIIQKRYLANYKDILILLSGSLANFLAAIFFKHNNFIILYFTNIFLGIFNLIPIESLDGGKILNIILFLLFPMKVAYNISIIISIFFITIFFILDFFFIIHGNFNITLSIICFILIFKILKS